MVVFATIHSLCCPFSSRGMNQIKTTEVTPFMGFGLSNFKLSPVQRATGFTVFTTKVTINPPVKCYAKQNGKLTSNSKATKNKITKKVGKKEQHLWKKRDSAESAQKALNLVRIVSELPSEKEAVYGALDKWTAWETEFPLIAVAKALRMLRQRGQWLRVIQMRMFNIIRHLYVWSMGEVNPCRRRMGLYASWGKNEELEGCLKQMLGREVSNVLPSFYVAKWMLSKGQGATMGTYDTLLLAFDKDKRADEAESLWNMILHTHARSISKQLFSRMISLYDHHGLQDKIIEVFGDMEEVGVRPDEDTVQRVARAFQKLGEEERRKLVLKKYQCKWKYIHFKGERVKVKRDVWDNNRLTN